MKKNSVNLIGIDVAYQVHILLIFIRVFPLCGKVDNILILEASRRVTFK